MRYFNRVMCEVFEEMRAAYKVRNFSYLPGLIEEAQVMGNRMEASLDDKRQKISDLKDEIAELKEEKKYV